MQTEIGKNYDLMEWYWVEMVCYEVKASIANKSINGCNLSSAVTVTEKWHHEQVHRCKYQRGRMLRGSLILVPGKGLVRSACLNIWALLEFFIEPVWTSKQERVCKYFHTSSTKPIRRGALEIKLKTKRARA